jgi:hypothetical protein
MVEHPRRAPVASLSVRVNRDRQPGAIIRRTPSRAPKPCTPSPARRAVHAGWLDHRVGMTKLSASFNSAWRVPPLATSRRP